MAQKPRIIKARSWSELPDTLEPGVVYDVDGVMIKPRVKLSRDEARGIAQGIKEMVEKQH